MGPVQPILAHPLTVPGKLDIPPLTAAVLAMIVVAAVVRFWPGGRRSGGPPERTPAHELHSWWGALGPLQVAGRVVGLFLLLLAIVAARVGSESEVSNVAPALLLGAGWPLLIAGSILVGPVWRWFDPWDGVARALDRGRPEPPAPHVWMAAAPAAVFAWYVGAYPDAYAPRSLGVGFALYAILAVGGSLVVGRQRWLSGAEVFGLFLSWSAIIRRGAGVAWRPPAGSEVVLGIMAGGLVFGAIRRSTLWGGLSLLPGALAWATLGAVALAGGFGALLWWLERRARDGGAPGSVAVAAVPAVAALALALAMYADVLFTSISLLPELFADPLGRGWNLYGWRLPLLGLCREGRLTCGPLLSVQTAVLLAGGIGGGIVLARRVPDAGARLPGMAALCLIVGGGVVAVTAS